MAENRDILKQVVPPAGMAQAGQFKHLACLTSYFQAVSPLAAPSRLANLLGRLA